MQDYKTVKSPPVHISPLDLGPKYADKLGPGFQEYSKTYPENYCLAQLIYWYSQNAEPESRLTRARKGCMSLPDVSSFYVKSVKPTQERVYGTRTVRFMLSRMVSATSEAEIDRLFCLTKSSLGYKKDIFTIKFNSTPSDTY
jgi:hypothetical protein